MTENTRPPTGKGCGHQIVFWGIVILSTWLFASLMGDNDWGPTLGIIIGIIVGWQVLSKLSQLKKHENDINTVSQNQRWIISNFGEHNEGYTVTYQSGHKGIDHYLRMYAKRNELHGTLVLSELGIRFGSNVTRSEKKFTLAWEDVREASHSSGEWLRIYTTNYGMISFTSDNASTITKQITDKLTDYQEHLAQQEELIENQILSRDLDSILPGKFENVISQLFQSMGYQVQQVGGPGDEGVDLVCKDSDNNEIIVQCKRYKGKVGVSTIRDFYGALNHRGSLKGYIVTTGEFTEPALRFIENKPIELINRVRLAALLNQYQLTLIQYKQKSFWD